MNREGETVGICLLGSGFGGRNCSERGVLSREGGVSVCFCWLCFLPDVITLWQQNDPPGAKLPSGFGGDGWVLVVMPGERLWKEREE